MEVQLGDPWTRPLEGARRSPGGGVGCQGAGKPKWDRWQASRVVEELAEQFEGWETSEDVSELEKDPFGEPGPPPGIPKSQYWSTLDQSMSLFGRNQLSAEENELYQTLQKQEQKQVLSINTKYIAIEKVYASLHLCIKMISCGTGCKFETAIKVLNGLFSHIDEVATRRRNWDIPGGRDLSADWGEVCKGIT